MTQWKAPRFSKAPKSHAQGDFTYEAGDGQSQQTLRKHGAANLLLWLYLADEQGNCGVAVVPFCAWRELIAVAADTGWIRVWMTTALP